MSLVSFIGPRPNILELEGTSKQKRLEVDQPILTNEDLERIRGIGAVKDNDFSSITIDITYPADKGEAVRRSTAFARRRKSSCARRNTTSSFSRTVAPVRIVSPFLRCSRRRRCITLDQARSQDVGRSRHRDHRRTDASVLHARRLRRGSDQSVPRVRNAVLDDPRFAGRARRRISPRSGSSRRSARPS